MGQFLLIETGKEVAIYIAEVENEKSINTNICRFDGLWLRYVFTGAGQG